MEEILEEVKNLIKSNQLAEVITTTNGNRKTVLKLKFGKPITYYDEYAKQVLILTSKY